MDKIESNRPTKRPKNEQNYFFNDVEKESLCGIREFLGEGSSWRGILKQRFEDFLVNEVDLDGNVVHLTDMQTVPVETKEEEKDEPIPSTDLAELIGTTTYEDIQSFVEQNDSSSTFSFQIDADKATRTIIHQTIRSIWPNLESSTKENEIVLSFQKKRGNRTPKRSSWPKSRGDYLHFVLYKENKDTTEVISLLSKMTRLRPRNFQYAGTKDKRGVTVQRASAYRLSAERCIELNQRLFGIKLGNYSYDKNHLQLGDLKGNQFVIVIRDVDASDEVIHDSCKQVQQNGFINYFGLQRFGTGSISTHDVGLALLKSDYNEAARLILCPREGESEQSNDARKYYMETKNVEETLKILPKQLHVERLLLQGFAKHGTNQFMNAFSMVPRNMRILYLHSYQSYVWNHMVSERLRIYGQNPVVGDLVLDEGELSELTICEEVTDEMEESTTKTSYPDQVKVKILTKADIQASKYSMSDIVLPLPGHSVIYPQNEMAQKYKEFLKKDGITEETFKHRVREFSLPGNYRKLIQRVMDFSWEILTYNDHTISLALTDYGKLKNNTIEKVEDGKHKAVKLQFILSGACYATMLFRQLLRSSSSAAYHKSLADAFMESSKEEQ